jgi:threonine synthase
LRRSAAENEASLWRYAPLLPVERRFASPLQVGWTPLLDCGRVGTVRLLLKDETRNPSGSLKDRASEVVVAVAAAHAIDEVIVASTGNAAASLACIGAAAGIKVIVLVPETVPAAKLAQSLAYGAQVHRIAGCYDDAYDMAIKIAQARGILNRSTGLNPFTREGKKTCAFEIAEQMDWQAPDWVIVPTGDGNILSSLWKGFKELSALGWLPALPRLVAAQSAASCVIARAHNDSIVAADSTIGTIADSITVDRPRDLTSALAALSESGGLAATVDDDEITAAVRALASRFGVFVEPSSAAAFAAFERLREAGRFGEHDRVVCLSTGTGLKDLRPVLTASMFVSEPAIHPAEWRNLASPLAGRAAERASQ